jgi:hypothetical protein
MRRKTSLLLAFVLLVTLVSIGSGGAAARVTSCISNPPPNCDFDPVCLEYCSVLHPKDAEARCLCGLGCCMWAE